MPSMTGKSILVTGGTGGIGKATAAGLAALGARVGITGSDATRTEAAAADIRAASGNPAVDAFTADMSSQAEVRRLAGEVLDAYSQLEVLVNNVGGVLGTPACHRRRPGTHLRAEPPRPVSVSTSSSRDPCRLRFWLG